MKFKHVKAFFIATMGIFALSGMNVKADQEVYTTGPFAGVKLVEIKAGADAAAEIEELSLENTKQAQTEEPEEEPEIVIATVSNYLRVRSEANLEAEIIGKLYNHSVGTLLEETEDGWYKIESGSVTGYVKAEYVLRGEEGKQLADEVGQRLAKVETMTLRVRQEANTESDIIGLLPDGDILEVLEEVDGWAKVSVEEGEGYVSTDYVDVYTKNTVAESKEEEEERLRKEEEARRQAEEAAAREAAAREAARQEAARQEAARRQAAQSTANSNTSAGGSSSNGNASSGNTTNGNATPSGNTTSGSSNGGGQQSDSSLGTKIANYALQFVGNPYVYGGTSLTNGADCSGFVMSVYQNFGISLPRTSGEQGQCGWDVGGIGNAKPGDLVWYSGHIGIYIGNGQIVHASSPRTGIRVSNATYRPILSVRRIV